MFCVAGAGCRTHFVCVAATVLYVCTLLKNLKRWQWCVTWKVPPTSTNSNFSWQAWAVLWKHRIPLEGPCAEIIQQFHMFSNLALLQNVALMKPNHGSTMLCVEWQGILRGIPVSVFKMQQITRKWQVTKQYAKCRNNIAQVWQHGIGLGKACIATAQPEPPAVSSTTRHEKRSSIKHYPTATSRLPHEKAVFSKVFATEGHKVLSSDDIISVILLPFRVECSIVNENEQPKAPTTLGCERVSQCVCSVRRTLVRDVEKNYVFFDRNPIILFQSAVRNHAIGT